MSQQNDIQNPNLDPANELPWIKWAKSKLGLKEIIGTKHNPEILDWVKELGGTWRDDETPWCGTFVAIALKRGSRAISKSFAWAKSYLNYGTKLTKPCYGCIGVMGRAGGGGHVTFIVGKTRDGSLVCLGGNQGNQVCLAKYPVSRFLGFVFPEKVDGSKSSPADYRYDLPIYIGNLTTVTSEA